MDELQALSLISFELVADARAGRQIKDVDYLFRHICRWYSKVFNTALHEVYELPTHDILRAFFEERFESLSDEDLEEERLELIKTDKQREVEARERALEDIDGLAMAKEEEAHNDTPVDKLIKVADKFNGALNRFKDKVPGKENAIEMGNVTTNLPPDIKMQFVDDLGDLDEDSLGLLDDPKKR